jgi:hypothetical protein
MNHDPDPSPRSGAPDGPDLGAGSAGRPVGPSAGWHGSGRRGGASNPPRAPATGNRQASVKSPLIVALGRIPQGAVVSPVLANLFLHHAFDCWMQRTPVVTKAKSNFRFRCNGTPALTGGRDT